MKRKIILTICLIVSLSTLAEGWLEKVPLLAFGGGVATEFKGDGNHIGYGGDIIALGALVSLTFTHKPELEAGCSKPEVIDKVTFYFGYTIPIKNYSTKNHIKRLFVSPIIEHNCISHYTGHPQHENIKGHHCKMWVHSGYATNEKMGYGGAVMYQYDVLYSMLKVTTKSANLSVGIAF